MTWTAPEIVTVVAVVVVIAAAFVGSIMLTRGLIKAGQSPAPSMLVVSLSLLSLSALLGGLVFDSDSALALSGAGIGALAGAVSSVFTSGRRNCEEVPDPPETTDADE